MKNFVACTGAALSAVLLSSTAFAVLPVEAPAVPEPSALAIIGGVAIAGLIANRFIRRKFMIHFDT